MRFSPALLTLALAVAGFPAAAKAQTTCTTGLCLQRQSCPAGSPTTTISGTVYAPNGVDPLPNVLVYIPNAAVDAFQPGVTCPVVGQPPSGSPIVGATTAFDGTFTLVDVPVGTGIPVVIQTGRWRRQVTIDVTNACADNAFVGTTLHMPRNQSEGDIPKIAVATGSVDQVECVLRKTGIDDAEFTNGSGTGRVNIYTGDGNPGASIAGATSQLSLMGDSATLNSYDVLMLPCEGGAYPGAKNATEYANLVNFANSGGRVYSSHYSYQWMYQNPPFNSVVNWAVNNGSYPDGLATVNTTFSEGVTLAQWLQVVGASTTLGQIELQTIKHDFNGVVAPTQSFLTLNSSGTTMQFVFNTPVTATANQCGRVLYNEYHVENGTSANGKVFPAECNTATTMTPQEKLLEFSLFELTSDGNAATLTPMTQDFGSEPVNFPSATQLFTWTNNSTFPASVNSITTTGDFVASGNNCSLVQAGASCTINVYFKPTAVGARTGTLTVGSSGSTLISTLTGTGVPDLVFSLSALSFGSLDVGATATNSFTVTNNASGPVNVPGLVTTGDYSATNSCGATVPGLGSCVVTVTFKPTAAGARPGTLAVNSSNPAYPATPTMLTGNGLDFSAATLPSSGNVIAGYSSHTTLVTTPLGGFAAGLQLSCSTNAPGSTCTLSSGGYSSASAVTTDVTFTTTAQYTVVGYSGFGGAGWLWVVGLSTGVLLFLGRRRLGTVARAGLVLVLVAVGTSSLTGCSGKLPAQNANPTLPGNYTFTITATDGFLVHSATYALNVTVK